MISKLTKFSILGFFRSKFRTDYWNKCLLVQLYMFIHSQSMILECFNHLMHIVIALWLSKVGKKLQFCGNWDIFSVKSFKTQSKIARVVLLQKWWNFQYSFRTPLIMCNQNFRSYDQIFPCHTFFMNEQFIPVEILMGEGSFFLRHDKKAIFAKWRYFHSFFCWICL